MSENNNKKVIVKKKKIPGTVAQLYQNAGIPVNKEDDKSWDNIQGIYSEIANNILEVANSINDAIRIINACAFENKKDITVTVIAVKSDIESFFKELAIIHKMHEGRTGGATDEDDLANCLEIFNSYNILFEKFKGVIFPSLLTITEGMAEAIKIIDAEKKLKETEQQNTEVPVDTKVN